MKLIKPFLLMVMLSAAAGCSMLSGDGVDVAAEAELGGDLEDRSAEELYNAAKAFLRTGDWESAIERLETLQGRYPFSPYAKQAQLDTIYAYYQLQEADSAIAAADRFLRTYPRDEAAAYVHYMRAMANLNRGKDFLTRLFGVDRSQRDAAPLRQAFLDLRELVERFPESEYADDARERMVVIRDDLAQHELHVAQYYMKRKAYLAAAERAQGIVENYQGAPVMDEALGIMAESYQALGLKDLREDVLRLIRINYPEHPALTGQS